MGLAQYATEMAVKEELKDLMNYIDGHKEYLNSDDPSSNYAVADIRKEIQRRINEPTEG